MQTFTITCMNGMIQAIYITHVTQKLIPPPPPPPGGRISLFQDIKIRSLKGTKIGEKAREYMSKRGVSAGFFMN